MVQPCPSMLHALEAFCAPRRAAQQRCRDRNTHGCCKTTPGAAPHAQPWGSGCLREHPEVGLCPLPGTPLSLAPRPAACSTLSPLGQRTARSALKGLICFPRPIEMPESKACSLTALGNLAPFPLRRPVPLSPGLLLGLCCQQSFVPFLGRHGGDTRTLEVAAPLTLLFCRDPPG